MFLCKCLTALLLLLTVWIYEAQTCDTFTDLNLGHAFLGTTLDVRLLLYTRADVSCGRLLSHSTPTGDPHFHVNRPTTFIIHGYRPSGSPPNWLGNLTEQILARQDHNVLVVDWNHGAANLDYLKVVRNTRRAAANLTAFLQNIQAEGASLSSVHMIGVSLGAHISGFVGASLNGTIGRITALDPAGPQFTDTSPEDRLDPTDAQFVDVVHTDMDALGFRKPLGHIDFYPNGGADQPGCPRTIFSGSKYFKCDHQRSVFLYLDSMSRTHNITAYPCDTFKHFLDGRCMDCEQFGHDGCPVFGYDVTQWRDKLRKLGQTSTFFSTNKQSPFCKTSYKLDMVIWNQEARWGYITITLHGGGKETQTTINHKAAKFEQYKETRLLAQFDKELTSVQKISVSFSTGNGILKPKYKLRVLRLRLTHLERKEDRPLCRYDLLLEENREVLFRPIPCEDSNF